MRDDTDEETSKTLSAAKQQRDFDDLQNEIIGADTGRMRKFLSADDARTPESKRRQAEQDRIHRMLVDLMRDPEYAALYVELGDTLSVAETEADITLAAIRRDLEAVQQEISLMEASAARDHDGNRVFRFDDGRVVYADGSDVDPEIVEGIVWPDNAPSAEDYFAARTQQQALEDRRADWDIYRHDVLGDIRNRYDSDDPAMSMDDLKRDLDRIEALSPATVALAQDTTSLEAPVVSPAAALAVPTVLK